MLDRAGVRMPVDRAARRLWGLPVVLVSSTPAERAVLLDASGTRLHMREDATLAARETGFVDDLFGTDQD